MAADSWRVMCKHLYNIKRLKLKIVDKELEPIINLIQLPTQAADSQEQTDEAAGEPSRDEPKPTPEGDVSGGVVEPQLLTPKQVADMLPRELLSSEEGADHEGPSPAAVAAEGPEAVINVSHPETWFQMGPNGEQIFINTVVIDSEEDDDTPAVTDLMCNCDECIAYAASFKDKADRPAAESFQDKADGPAPKAKKQAEAKALSPEAEAKAEVRSPGGKKGKRNLPRSMAVDFESEVVQPQKKQAVIEGYEPPPPAPVLAPVLPQQAPSQIELPRKGPLAIPCAKRGGQKRETLKRKAELEEERKARAAATTAVETTVTPKRRRFRSKSTPSSGCAEEHEEDPEDQTLQLAKEDKKPRPKAKGKGKSQTRTPRDKRTPQETKPKNSQQEVPDPDKIVFPITMEVHQRTPARCADAYLLRGTKKDRYIAGQTEKASARFLENIDVLKGKLEAGEITTRYEAREWVQKQIS